jgi:CheY-like chemotaxis protein
MQKVLLIEDDSTIPDAISEQLTENGFGVEASSNGIEGLDKVRSDRPDVVLIDQMLPDMDGVVVIEALRDGHLRMPVLVLSALDRVAERVRGLNAIVASIPPNGASYNWCRQALTHLYLSSFGLFSLRQHYRNHAILQLRTDFTLIDLVGDFKAARIVPDVVFGVDGLHPLILREVNPPLDCDDIVLHVGLNAVALDTGHFKHNGQSFGSFEDVGHRHEHARRRRALGLLVDLALLLDLQFLGLGHVSTSSANLDRARLIGVCPWYEQR